jgi:hypothetical protein
MVSNAVHQAALIELARERGKREASERQIAEQSVVMRFLMARCNQLEAERVALFKAVSKVDIPVGQLVPAAVGVDARDVPTTNPQDAMLEALGGAGMFEDVGDDAAARMGIGWNRDGRVTYGTPQPARAAANADN